jgi:hypothetical protein
MGTMGLLLLTGIALTLRWGGAAYRPWELAGAGPSVGQVPPGAAARRYLRGAAIALVAGVWAGALVTGPAVRLVMRLLAVTSGDEAQRRLTEADEVVGSIDLGGTIGLVLFGGVLPGIVSGALYVLLRRLLPEGRLAGVVFGALHLVLAATRIDPLRPDNPDFDLLGPGWLSVLTFGVTAILHGMAVVAIANRYSLALPASPLRSQRRWLVLLPLVLAAVVLAPAAPVLVPVLTVGLVVAVAASRSAPILDVLHSGRLVPIGRAVVLVVTVVLLPGTLVGLHDVVVGDEETAAPTAAPP